MLYLKYDIYIQEQTNTKNILPQCNNKNDWGNIGFTHKDGIICHVPNVITPLRHWYASRYIHETTQDINSYSYFHGKIKGLHLIQEES